MKGKVEVNKRLIPLNVLEIIEGLAEFNQRLFQTKGVNEQLKVELKSYVEG